MVFVTASFYTSADGVKKAHKPFVPMNAIILRLIF
jgi:hypothetical protein